MNAFEHSKRGLIVIAKRPVPGEVKTRIGVSLGPEAAAELYRASLLDTLELVSSLPGVEPAVSYAPATEEARAYFEGIAPGFHLVPQVEPSFGERLFGAFRGMFALGFGEVCLVGTDNPSLPVAHLETAFRLLGEPETDVVLGPVSDGGYYLLGMKAPQPALFERITWSTEVVAEQTRERAREAGLRLAEVPAWYDLDTADDLRHLREEVGSSGRAPRTMAYLESAVL